MEAEGIFGRKLAREQTARREAESLLDIKSYELYETNQGLQQARSELEERVESRTQALTRVVDELQKEIGRRKAMEQELRSARDSALELADLKSEFLARVSHEIRTPLNAVIGLTGVVLETELTTAQHQRVETIQASAQLLLRLINDILDLSKIDAKKFELEYSAAKLKLLTKQTVSLVWLEATKRGIVFEIKHEPADSDCVTIDGGRLQQLLLNLLSNAIKYSDGGTVRISTKVEGRPSRTEIPEALRSAIENQPHGLRVLRVTVQDEGRGIGRENLETLFDPFTQFEGTAIGSSGLGLTICQRICELMGGSIGVESTLGKGSTFEFTLPCAVIDKVQPSREEADAVARLSAAPVATTPVSKISPSAERQPATPRLGQRKPLSILLADDYEVNRLVQQTQLEHLGYAADLVTNGEEVLRALRERAYDVVLMDIRMPVMDGLETTRRIRHDTDSPQPYIVALTASALAGDPERFAAAGIDGYLPKPVELQDLAEVLDVAYERLSEVPMTAEPEVYGPPVEIDVSSLRSRLGPAVDSLLRRVIPVFIRELPARKQNLRAAYEAADSTTFGQLCHGLKGSSRSIGAADLAAACELHEKQGFDGKLPSTGTLAELLTLADGTAHALSALLDTIGDESHSSAA